MNFLADENFPLASTQLLIANGHNVRQTAILFQGKPDAFLLAEAVLQQEIILTFDKDFGELIFKITLPAGEGVVLFRLQRYLPQVPGEILLTILQTQTINLSFHLTVIDENKIRQRPIQ